MPDAGAFLERFGAHLQASPDRMIERIVDRTYAEVPAYAGVPRPDLLEATRETTAVAAAAFRQQRPASTDDLAFDVETVRRRVRQGVTSSGWIAHVSVYLDEARAEAECLAQREGIPDSDVLAGVVAILASAQDLLAFANRQFEEAAQELLQRDEDERRAYLTALLHGALTPAGARAGAIALGIDPDARHAAVRIRPGTQALAARLARAEPTVGARGAWIASDGEVLGISRDGVPGDVAPATAGIGPAVPLEGLGESFALATSALETASRFRRSGAHRIQDLGALPLVTVEGHVADLVQERFVGRLVRDGGETLVATVRAYLDHGLSPGATAKALHLHPNSLRKRLARYEELTGADIGSMDDLVAIWWAMRRHDLDDAG